MFKYMRSLGIGLLLASVLAACGGTATPTQVDPAATPMPDVPDVQQTAEPGTGYPDGAQAPTPDPAVYPDPATGDQGAEATPYPAP